MTTRRLLILFFCLSLTLFADDKPAAPEVTFTEHLVADKYGYAFGVVAAELDGDGDLDLTSCDTRGDALYWFVNDGKGTFQRHFIQSNEPGWFERHAVGDIN